MRRYRDFGICTRDALRFACAAFGVRESQGLMEGLMAAYGRLPAFPDAREGLERARAAGLRCYAFSNGRADAVEAVLGQAGLRDLVLGVVSVDDLGTFKPDPAVYAHFLEIAGAAAAETWLVSGNAFDLIGAVNAGLNAVWLRRDPEALADPWEIGPTLSLSSLVQLPEALSVHGRPGLG
jgi:2-haloacid dehalogenase